MNIKKIISFLLFVLIIICTTTITYASSIPSPKESSNKIKSYIDEGNDLTLVSISTLLSWYNTVSSSTIHVQKIDTALKSQPDDKIKNYISSLGNNNPAEQLKNKTYNCPDVLSAWLNQVTDANTKNIINAAYEKVQNQHKEATDKTSIQFSTVSPDSFKPSDTNLGEKSTSIADKYLGIVQAIGSIVSVGALAIIGIKYMLGSVEEKAEYKSTMFPYIIGAILTFAASNLVGIIYSWIS